jgi:hypothetical protein
VTATIPADAVSDVAIGLSETFRYRSVAAAPRDRFELLDFASKRQ